MDIFTASAPLSLGTIRHIEIGFADSAHTTAGYVPTMLRDAWLLSSVEVADLTTGLNTVFEYGDWLNKKRPRIQLSPVSSYQMSEAEVSRQQGLARHLVKGGKSNL